MKVGIIGGGPAGLYLAILLKRADPTHDVALVERNPPGATFGWGVVFSVDTLRELEAADAETWQRIDDALVRWDALDIRYRGRTVRSRGHGFAAISRIRLLRLLQQRARDVGVDLTFNREVAPGDVRGVFADADVIVGADGINSTVRERFADHFRPSFQEHASRYAWFGTDLVFEAFTFIFAETDHGLFTVHAYPFDAETSTFIVECMPDTWRSAGLDGMSETESLTFCQKLFADHLDGHELKSNRSVWTSFVTVANDAWHHDNVVLAGDAAHTAHFSIGSGTKLAVEDAIALTDAVSQQTGGRGSDPEAIFAAYELERQAAVERFQEAATDSARYFAGVDRYLGFDHEQFAFNLLTRSGRITHLNLQLRDPATVNDTDRWYASRATGDDAARRTIGVTAPLTQPLALRDVEIDNRLVITAPPIDRADHGQVNALHAAQLGAAAGAGAGLVVTEPTAVSFSGRITPGTPGLWSDEQAHAWEEILDRARGTSVTRFAVRLTHAGPRGATRPRRHGLDRPLPEPPPWPLVAASPQRYLPHSAAAAPLDAAGCQRVIEDFRQATALAVDAGFDVVVVDCSDGYLLNTFLSPLTNRRDDAYGGDLAGRVAFPLEVVDAVRDVWPSERPLAVRLNADDRRPGGFTTAQAVPAAGAFADAGVDLVDVVAGHTVPWGTAAGEYRRGYRVELASTVRNEAGLPVVASGNITTTDEVNTTLAAGRADLVVLEPGRYYARDWRRR